MLIRATGQGGHYSDIYLIFYNIKVYCMFSLESPHRGDSNQNTQYTTLNYSKSATMGFFEGTQERV